jgi:hypothetical protein
VHPIRVKMLLGVIADSDKEINASKKITMFQKKK